MLEAAELPLHLLDSDDRIKKALAIAQRLYEGKLHWTGLPLLQHTLGVLSVLMPFHPDADTVCACLLQHALEQRRTTLTELEEEFGVSVKTLVSAVHLLSHVSMRGLRSSIDDLRLMLLSVSDDIRVLLIVLSNRCHVLEHLDRVPAAEARRICREVLDLFAPVAARLGIHALKQRMEALAFPLVYPADYERVTEQQQNIAKRHGSFLPASAVALTQALKQQGINADVQGREKLPFSIFSKMKSKSITDISMLPDLFALRVLVDTEEDCYRALGLLHRMGRPVANRFKDYIAFPKPNGYRSLHTTISRLPEVPEGVFIEVQVRTHAMHREAEYGIAAHWSYKEGGKAERMMQRVALQQMLTSQEPVQGVRGTQRLVDHIFVLSPKGDVIELPEGATPLDFAFQIHTQLGLSFRAARVNGSIVPMEYELENGDVVEIMTHALPKPSPEWMQLLTMSSSRSRLRRYLYSMDREGYVEKGKVVFNEELRRRRLPKLDSDLSVLRRYEGKYLNREEREDVLMKLGQGTDRANLLVRRLDLIKDAQLILPVRESRRAHVPASAVPVETEGGVPMPIKFAKCCSPLEGDHEKITGSVTRTGEVMVHKAKCRLIKNANPERRIGVRWRRT